MGYLGLDETPVKDDNLFQRLFWPSDNASDTDALGVQGLWICMIVAALSTIWLLVAGSVVTALITLAFFVLGGIGVREHSVPAAVLVAFAYLVGIVGNIFLGIPPGVLPIIAATMLLTNIRATHIANRWAKDGDPSAMPERRQETVLDRFVDQMPSKVWPAARFGFFCVAGVYCGPLIAGTLIVALHPHHL
jgi:hypothetical protein